MKAFEIRIFREKLFKDNDNLVARRILHENYEWLESYWHDKYKGNNHIDKFTNDFNSFYWNLPEIKKISKKFSFYPPVASSNRNFEPTEAIKRATYFLRHHSELHDDFPDTNNEKEIGLKWTKSSFNALLTIVKQIRDNLFHGRKMDIEEERYNRNKELINMAVEATTDILEKLEQAENENLPCNNFEEKIR